MNSFSGDNSSPLRTIINPREWKSSPFLALFRVGMYHAYMRDTLVGESVEEIIETAKAQGFTVTEPQLVRWHRAGLLQPFGQPIPRRFLGRGRGSETVYPTGTGERVVALCEALAARRSLPRAGWSLWWQGYEVAPTFARDPIEQALKEIEGLVVFAQAHGELSDKLIDNLTARPTPLVGAMRKHLGRKDFPRVMRVCVSLYDGTFAGWQGDDEYLIERALHIDEARESKIGGMKELFRGGITGTAREMARLLNVRQLRHVLDAATDGDLAAARDEVQFALAAFDNALYIIERLFGRNKFLHALLPNSESLTGDLQPGFVLHWLSFRQMPGFETGYRQVFGALSQFGNLRPTLETISSDHDAAMKKAMRRRQPSHGTTHGKEPSVCETSLHPPSPP